MESGFDPGALLARTYALPTGPRVTLRLPRARDRAGIEALLRRRGVPCDALEPGRLVNFDPTRRVVLCATALIDAREQLVGFGAVDLLAAGARAGVDAGTDADADAGGRTTVVVAPELADGLAPLLRDALIGQAGWMRRGRRAA